MLTQIKKILKAIIRETILFILVCLAGAIIAHWLGMPFQTAFEKTFIGTLSGFGIYWVSRYSSGSLN